METGEPVLAAQTIDGASLHRCIKLSMEDLGLCRLHQDSRVDMGVVFIQVALLGTASHQLGILVCLNRDKKLYNST